MPEKIIFICQQFQQGLFFFYRGRGYDLIYSIWMDGFISTHLQKCISFFCSIVFAQCFKNSLWCPLKDCISMCVICVWVYRRGRQIRDRQMQPCLARCLFLCLHSWLKLPAPAVYPQAILLAWWTQGFSSACSPPTVMDGCSRLRIECLNIMHKIFLIIMGLIAVDNIESMTGTWWYL